MHEQTYCVELLSDIVITADAATAGGHQGLDYLPGSLFLGAAVAQAMGPAKVFDPDLFLSGLVRFHNGLPDVGGKPSFPVPLAFHQIKGKEWAGQPPLNLLTNDSPASDQQPQQWREGYMTADGDIVRTRLGIRMKTAIDRDSRRSAEGQMFGYQSIPAGTVFHTRIQSRDSAKLLDIRRWLEGRSVRLGRSRSAEYGVAKMTCSDVGRPAPAELHNGLVHLYLWSDLAILRDGMPSLLPTAADFRDFGLPGNASTVPEKCFLRTRRYAAWNRFFNCRMEERQVLCKGGVITFRLPPGKACDPVDLQSRLEGGIGMHCEEGLGQILVNPPWLLHPPALHLLENVAVSSPARPADSSLIGYLERKRDLRVNSAEAFTAGVGWANEWLKLSNRIAKQDAKVPGRSQWSNIRAIAVRCQDDPGKLRNQIEAFCTESLRRRLWGASVRCDSLQKAIFGTLDKAKPDGMTCLKLYHAAVAMSRRVGRDRKTEEVNS